MILVDNFIKDKRIFTKIKLDNRFWYDTSYWWWGWWNTEEKSIQQEIIAYIFRDHSPMEPLGLCGFEHSITTYNPNKIYYGNTPLLRALLFIDPKIEDCKGGYLEIKIDATEDSPSEIIKPKFNRLIIFEGDRHFKVNNITKKSKVLCINLWNTLPFYYEQLTQL